MSEKLTCDVLVIGAGPAGSMAAFAAAREGAAVIMLDSRREVGFPVRCAEYIPFQLASEVGLDKTAVSQSVESMRTWLPDGRFAETEARGVICNRELFDRQLASQAEAAGVRLLRATRAFAFEKGVVMAAGGGGRDKSSGNGVAGLDGRASLQVHAQAIVGADGPSSVVRRWMGLTPNRTVQARQYVLRLAKPLSTTEIFFDNDIPGGYGWVFPKKDVANVGIGIDRKYGMRPSQVLDRFVDRLVQAGIIDGAPPLATTAGLIPVGGQCRLSCGHMLLAGDAAGQCNPVTGAGVPNAVFAGTLAGEAAAQASAAAAGPQPEDGIAGYREACRLFLGESLQRAVRKREYLDRFWGASNEELTEAVRKSWIAFDEYYLDTESEQYASKQ